jgi:addiction module HigA family antidote
MRTVAPVSPGEMLEEEFLKPLGLTKYRLAKDIGVPPQRIGDIVAGKRSVTADTDLRLCRYFGLSAAVERDADRVSGAWVFRGTRVPVAALFENLEDGVSVIEFADLFPGVTIEQARSVLEHAAKSSLATP